MAAHADTGGVEARSSAGQALAHIRWAPETRLRVAAETVIARAAELPEGTRAAIEAAISAEVPAGDG
jgi:hypothetical protein